MSLSQPKQKTSCTVYKAQVDMVYTRLIGLANGLATKEKVSF
jgi:hypothetical protein